MRAAALVLACIAAALGKRAGNTQLRPDPTSLVQFWDPPDDAGKAATWNKAAAGGVISPNLFEHHTSGAEDCSLIMHKCHTWSLAEISELFDEGRPDNGLSRAGLTVHGFDGTMEGGGAPSVSMLSGAAYEDSGALPWLPCKSGWCQNATQWLSTSIISNSYRAGFSDGGMILNPVANKVLCSHYHDFNSLHSGCTSDVNTYGLKLQHRLQHDNKKPFPADDLKGMLERSVEYKASYNEVLLDSFTYTSNLPRSVSAFYFGLLAESGSDESWSRVHATQMYVSFLDFYNLTEDQVPLVQFAPGSKSHPLMRDVSAHARHYLKLHPYSYASSKWHKEHAELAARPELIHEQLRKEAAARRKGEEAAEPNAAQVIDEPEETWETQKWHEAQEEEEAAQEAAQEAAEVAEAAEAAEAAKAAEATKAAEASKEAAAVAPQPLSPSEKAAAEAEAAERLGGWVLVHMHYYEKADMRECEIVTKRTNLAVFIEHAMAKGSDRVFFHITNNGDPFPSVSDFYGSIGAPVPSRATLFPALGDDHLLLEHVGESSTDLCPRAAVLRAAPRRNQTFSYVLFLNDGARGPLATPTASSPLRSFSDAINASAAPHLPWLAPFMSLMTSDPRLAAVGALMSCERKVHLQSWAVLLDWRVADIFLESYEASCHTSNRLEAISTGEIGPYEQLLARGFAMASLYPAVHYLDQRTPMTNALRATLHGCTNPLGGYNGASKASSDASREANRTMALRQGTDDWPSISTLGFVKFGGEPWRERFFSDVYTERVSRATERKLGTRACPRPDDAPPARMRAAQQQLQEQQQQQQQQSELLQPPQPPQPQSQYADAGPHNLCFGPDCPSWSPPATGSQTQ